MLFALYVNIVFVVYRVYVKQIVGIQHDMQLVYFKRQKENTVGQRFGVSSVHLFQA
jgi:hypothetical protein